MTEKDSNDARLRLFILGGSRATSSFSLTTSNTHAIPGTNGFRLIIKFKLLFVKYSLR